MSSSKAKPIPRRPQADPEVQTPEHDELLTWLSTSLERVVAHTLGRSPEWIERVAAEKRAQARQHIDEVRRRLEAVGLGRGDDGRLGDRPGDTPQVRQLATNKAAELRAWLEHPRWPKCGDALGATKVQGWELMKPVALVQPSLSPSRPDRRTPAGFVDLAVRVQRVADLQLEGLPLFMRSRLIDTQSDLATISRIELADITWRSSLNDFDLWISVRSGTFTLGEILQELKGLRLLEDGKQRVALCVNKLDDGVARALRHERIYVIEREVIERDGLDYDRPGARRWA